MDFSKNIVSVNWQPSRTFWPALLAFLKKFTLPDEVELVSFNVVLCSISVPGVGIVC